MEMNQRLLDLYLPPTEGFILESLLATTYQVDFEFFEEELLAAALGVRSPISRMRAFRSELERRLQTTDVTVLYDLRGCERLARLSPRIDPIPIVGRKLHSKISLLMWVRHASDGGDPDRLVRLIVGSANLTRQGFRENYECIVPVTYGGEHRSPRTLLSSAINLVRQIADESDNPQLQRQLDSFQRTASAFPDGETGDADPRDLVIANEVLPRMESRWAELSESAPEKLTIVSPFWPEGVTAADAIHDLIGRFRFPPVIELVCRGAAGATGSDWIPEFDAEIANALKSKIDARLFLRPALPDAGMQNAGTADEDVDDETEDREIGRNVVAATSDNERVQRPLHAKMIILDGRAGTILYVGSSNCTRRGLGLGGPTNWETGFIYRLTAKQRRQIESLLAFAGPATEVLPDRPLRTATPTREDEPAVPLFLSEVTAEDTKVTVRFREDMPIPGDLIILMEVPSAAGANSYWVLYRHTLQSKPVQEIVTELATCPTCDSALADLPAEQTIGPILPHVFVEVRWEGKHAIYPVRFDDKATLPRLLVGRKPTEGELIEYFLFGHDPGDDGGDGENHGSSKKGEQPDGPIDTRRILAYFIRRFVQAIPGIEAELQQAGYSQTALNAALRGPTSPLELAERAFASLSRPSTPDEPEKTPTAVAFQLTEILAALLRGQAKLQDETLRDCFNPAISRCHELLDRLAEAHPELREGPFRVYQDRFVGGKP